MLLLALLLTAGMTPREATSQATATAPLDNARRLRDRGDLAAAAALLAPWVDTHPDDIEAVRTLAQLRYWQHDVDAARTLYRRTLERHPEAAALRFDYAQLLLDTRADRELRDVLAPVRANPPTRGRAAALLGTDAYWRGDLTTARRELRIALMADPSRTDVQRDLDAIRLLTSPWVHVSYAYRHDTQPLDQFVMATEAGWFVTPLTQLSLGVSNGRPHSGDSISISQSRAEARLQQHIPAAHLDLVAAAGALQRSAGDVQTWTGAAAATVHLPRHVALRVAAEREPYLYTLASLGTLVMTRTARATLTWNSPRGWLAEATAERQAFDDDNAVRTAYAWLLAPLVHHDNTTLQVGASAVVQDADASRWTLARPVQAVPASSAAFRLDGLYAPYFTPLNLSTQSVLMAGRVRLSPTVTVRADGAYGVHATDDAPVIVRTTGNTGAGQLSTVTYRRSYHPFSARAAFDIAAGSSLTLTASADVQRTVLYTTSGMRLEARYRFAHPRVAGTTP
jgi:tetratricopeptide (TPR) repeat protein